MFSLPLLSCHLHMKYLGVDFWVFITFGILYAPWFCSFFSVINFGKILDIITSKLSCYIILYVLIFQLDLFHLWKFSHRSWRFRLCSLYFGFSLCFAVWVISIYLTSRSLVLSLAVQSTDEQAFFIYMLYVYIFKF